jgi:hypothetical protein
MSPRPGGRTARVAWLPTSPALPESTSSGAPPSRRPPLFRRPRKHPFLQPLIERREPAAIPERNLHPIPPAMDKHEQRAREGILAEDLWDPTRQTIKAAPHVRRRGRDKDANRWGPGPPRPSKRAHNGRTRSGSKGRPNRKCRCWGRTISSIASAAVSVPPQPAMVSSTKEPSFPPGLFLAAAGSARVLVVDNRPFHHPKAAAERRCRRPYWAWDNPDGLHRSRCPSQNRPRAVRGVCCFPAALGSFLSIPRTALSLSPKNKEDVLRRTVTKAERAAA